LRLSYAFFFVLQLCNFQSSLLFQSHFYSFLIEILFAWSRILFSLQGAVSFAFGCVSLLFCFGTILFYLWVNCFLFSQIMVNFLLCFREGSLGFCKPFLFLLQHHFIFFPRSSTACEF
jgi:hypothetical protein